MKKILSISLIASQAATPALLHAQNLPLSSGQTTQDQNPTQNTNPLMDPNIIAATIGIVGIITGSIITILASKILKWSRNKKSENQ